MLDNDNKYGVDESTVLTFAETLYEAGFDPDEAVAIAWGIVGLMADLGAL